MTNSINMYMLGNTRAVPREAYRGLKISRVPTNSPFQCLIAGVNVA